MEVILSVASLIGLILVIWFKTNAFSEYANLLRIGKWCKIDQADELELDYLEYLKEYHPCFLTKLFTCPICLGTWLGIFGSLVTGIAAVPITTLFGLFFYLVISKLL